MSERYVITHFAARALWYTRPDSVVAHYWAEPFSRSFWHDRSPAVITYVTDSGQLVRPLVISSSLEQWLADDAARMHVHPDCQYKPFRLLRFVPFRFKSIRLHDRSKPLG